MFYVSRFDYSRVWVTDTEDGTEECIGYFDAMTAENFGVSIRGIEKGYPSVYSGCDAKALMADGVAVVVRDGTIVHLQPMWNGAVVVPSRYGRHVECMIVNNGVSYMLILDGMCSFDVRMLSMAGRAVLDLHGIPDGVASDVYGFVTRDEIFASSIHQKIVDMSDRLEYNLNMMCLLGRLDKSVLDDYAVRICAHAEAEFLSRYRQCILDAAAECMRQPIIMQKRVRVSPYADDSFYSMSHQFREMKSRLNMDSAALMMLLGYIDMGGTDKGLHIVYDSLMKIVRGK